MVEPIKNPYAQARLTWLTPDEGGRELVPTKVYAATTAFADGVGDHHLDWALGPHDLSIIIEPLAPAHDRSHLVWVSYIAPQIAVPRLLAHDRFLVFEGPNRVAFGTFTARFVEDQQPPPSSP